LGKARLAGIGFLVLALAATAAWQACSSGSPSGRACHNVVLVVLDTVRADRLSCYGNSRPTTPAIDALARTGVRFERVQAAAPWTIPSMASIWTGVLPSTHGAGLLVEPKVFDGKGSFRGFDETALATLPQLLAQRGYHNAAFIANPLLRGMPCFLGAFERKHLRVAFVKAETAVDEAIAWLPRLGENQPFFLLLQLMDAHQPLDPPKRYRDLFATDGAPRDDQVYAAWSNLTRPEHMRSERIPGFRETRMAVYDGALRYMDDQLARLLEELERRDLRDDTLIVVMADHGEEFWDHGVEQTELYDCGVRVTTGIGHGQTQFQELLSVPLVFAGPGIVPGEVATRVSLLDLGATLLDVACGEPGAVLGDGRSFGALLRGEDAPGRAAVSEETSFGYELKALVQPDGLKYVLAHKEGERSSLYDLGQDPGERHDLSAERPDDAARMRTELTAIVDAARRKRAGPGAVTEGNLEELEALGYAGGSDALEPEPEKKAKREPKLPTRLKVKPGLKR
jgi:arylsulfatase A-like enzyme